MNHTNTSSMAQEVISKPQIKSTASINRDGLTLFMGSLIFLLAMLVNTRTTPVLNEWRGVIAQVQVLVSVYLTIRVLKKGYYTAVVLNSLASIMAIIQLIMVHDSQAIPGIVIPICTIVIISVILRYMYRLADKVQEVQVIKDQRAKEIIELQDVSIMAMAALAETRDNDTGQHIQRTKLYVKVLAEYLYDNQVYPSLMNEQMIALLVASAPLHDIGKVGIPDSILLKPGRLTSEEFEVIKQHTALGNEAIMKAEKLMGADETFLKYAQEIILYHHERWDGKGYLHQLKGHAIPLSARIMSVADVYDALTSKRCYKEIHAHDAAINIIKEGAGTQFDPKIVEAFMVCKDQFRHISEAYGDH